MDSKQNMSITKLTNAVDALGNLKISRKYEVIDTVLHPKYLCSEDVIMINLDNKDFPIFFVAQLINYNVIIRDITQEPDQIKKTCSIFKRERSASLFIQNGKAYLFLLIFGKRQNKVPLLLVRDLAPRVTVSSVVQNWPSMRYIVADARINLSKYDPSDKIKTYQREKLFCCQKSAVSHQTCDQMTEYKVARRLRPVKIVVFGSPASGNALLAQYLADYCKVHYVRIKTLIFHTHSTSSCKNSSTKSNIAANNGRKRIANDNTSLQLFDEMEIHLLVIAVETDTCPDIDFTISLIVPVARTNLQRKINNEVECAMCGVTGCVKITITTRQQNDVFLKAGLEADVAQFLKRQDGLFTADKILKK
ncbi:hypothetical protein PUN28_004806 [Cardiocondyla obscurior]|uniref:Uncharacterized protein n=1 Tax=Cardiocondyla obscurior TaxID=286306 RepID=A0AAW2GFD6_9HYME